MKTPDAAFECVSDLEFLAHCHIAHVAEGEAVADPSIARTAVRLIERGLLVRVEGAITTTPKGAALIDLLMQTPEPVPREEWTDPRTQKRIERWSPA